MSLTIFLGFCVILIGYLICLKLNNARGKQLPGPMPLPIIGNLLSIGFRPHIKFTKWAKRYGPIYGIKLGLKNAVVVSDPKLIKELFNEPASIGRMGDNPVMMEFTKGPYGIVNSSGTTWETQRSFTMRTLRSLGFAKASMETMILDEVQIMLDWFRRQEGSPISAVGIFTSPVNNSLWRIMSGQRSQWEEGQPTLSDALDNFFKELMNVSINGLLFAPFLRLIAPNLFGWNRYVKCINIMYQHFENSIAVHRKNFDSTELRDFMDHHLLEIENETDIKSSFYKDVGNANLRATMFDMFFGGSISTSHTLSWTLLYLSENQKVQEKLLEEIETVVGSTLPSLSDRDSMPYTEAVISEILRITSMCSIGVPHSVLSDLDFHGYHLPMGTIIFSNIYAVLHDPNFWCHPECFRPERFLNKDETKCVPNEAFIPFSAGKRKCVGDTFARDTLFLFLTSICQQFKILPDPNKKENPDFEPEFGLALSPKPFKIVLTSSKYYKPQNIYK